LEFQVAQVLENTAKTTGNLVYLFLYLEVGFEHISVDVVDAFYFGDRVDVSNQRECLLDQFLNLLRSNLVSHLNLVALPVSRF